MQEIELKTTKDKLFGNERALWGPITPVRKIYQNCVFEQTLIYVTDSKRKQTAFNNAGRYLWNLETIINSNFTFTPFTLWIVCFLVKLVFIEMEWIWRDIKVVNAGVTAFRLTVNTHRWWSPGTDTLLKKVHSCSLSWLTNTFSGCKKKLFPHLVSDLKCLTCAEKKIK